MQTKKSNFFFVIIDADRGYREERKRAELSRLIKINGHSIDLRSWIDSSLGNFFPLILSVQLCYAFVWYFTLERKV